MNPCQEEIPDEIPIKRFDATFLIDDAEKALSFVHESTQSGDVGLISKCLIWITLLLSELPRDLKDAETGLPLYPEELIDRILAQVSILYIADCTPACSIDSIEALVLQYELFISIGRPSRAWKCIRAGIENAMLLGLHLPRQRRLYGGVWDSLWVRDRQISLILGLPYTVPENLTLKTAGDRHSNPELEALRRIASISGCISDRDRMRQDTPFNTMTRIVEEMRELKLMIPDERGIEAINSASYSILRLFKHSLNMMIHLPYSQFAGYDKQFEYTRVEVLESAEGAIQAHRDIRGMQDKPVKCDLYDFLAFNAAVILVADLAAKETPRSTGEEQRVWNTITEFASRLRKISEVIDNATADQAAEVLENLHTACKGRFRGQFQVVIPYFGLLKIRSTENLQEAETPKIIVQLESSVYTFRTPAEHLTEKELAGDWSAEIEHELNYGWRGVYEFPSLV
ncbi:hypothetical protein FLONG3_7244 [Fusarium longipes]|uniref:Transcription factor domain-containing protein n=1 Tax=Fusarium longipes TaxID=694270 RepID=A0A395SFE6_9HYPO|nr:hypothetical protein FLONG3_7244 [Fusarium longipes]